MNEINTVSCAIIIFFFALTDAFMNQAPTAGHPIIVNSNTIELTVHTFCYLGLRLTLC